MTKSLKIAGFAAAALMLGVSFASAQAPTMGRGDQSGGGAAQMSDKPMGAPEVTSKPRPRMMKSTMTRKQKMRHARMMRQKKMMNRGM